MTIDEAMAEITSQAEGRTRWEGQPTYLDEMLVGEIETLRAERDKLWEVSGCPPDCGLLKWVRMLSRFFDRNAEAVQSAEAAGGEK